MTTTEILDATQRPSAVFAAATDPAKSWPGAPPNFGDIVVPHAFTVSGQTGLAGKAYLNSDEAVRHNRANAEPTAAESGGFPNWDESCADMRRYVGNAYRDSQAGTRRISRCYATSACQVGSNCRISGDERTRFTSSTATS